MLLQIGGCIQNPRNRNHRSGCSGGSVTSRLAPHPFRIGEFVGEPADIVEIDQPIAAALSCEGVEAGQEIRPALGEIEQASRCRRVFFMPPSHLVGQHVHHRIAKQPAAEAAPQKMQISARSAI